MRCRYCWPFTLHTRCRQRVDCRARQAQQKSGGFKGPSNAAGAIPKQGPPTGNRGCFICGKADHKFRECPRNRTPRNEASVRRVAVVEQTPQSDDPVWGRVEDGPSQSSPETSLKTVRRVAVQPVGMAVESTVEVRAVSVLQPVRCQVRLETGSVVSALVDSGAEISLLHSSMLPEPWLQSQPQRSVKLQGAFADPNQGHVVRVGAGLADADEGVHLEVAVTPELVGESMLLTPSDYAALVEASPTCTLSGGFISNTRVRPDPSVRDPDEQFRHDMETSLVHDVREVTVDSVGRVPFPVDLSSYLESSTSEGAEEFKRAQETDEGLASVWKEARDVRKKSSYFVDEAKGLLFQRKQFGANAISQLVVPACKRAKVLEIAHDSPWGGHFGANKTLKRIELNFTWPGISVDVAEYTRSCVKC